MKRSHEFNLDACIGDYYTTKRPTPTVPTPTPAPPPAPPPAPAPAAEPVIEAVPEAQTAAQKMLHELINGPPLLTPLAALQPQAQPPPLAVDVAPEAPPLDPHRHRHAGILREFGGVRAWLRTREAV